MQEKYVRFHGYASRALPGVAFTPAKDSKIFTIFIINMVYKADMIPIKRAIKMLYVLDLL
jgi:hypothetical protein